MQFPESLGTPAGKNQKQFTEWHQGAVFQILKIIAATHLWEFAKNINLGKPIFWI